MLWSNFWAVEQVVQGQFSSKAVTAWMHEFNLLAEVSQWEISKFSHQLKIFLTWFRFLSESIVLDTFPLLTQILGVFDWRRNDGNMAKVQNIGGKAVTALTWFRFHGKPIVFNTFPLLTLILGVVDWRRKAGNAAKLHCKGGKFFGFHNKNRVCNQLQICFNRKSKNKKNKPDKRNPKRNDPGRKSVPNKIQADWSD